MTQDRALSTLQGARDSLLSSTRGQQQPKHSQVPLGFMKFKFTSENNKKAKRNTPLIQTKKSRLPCAFSDVMTSLKSHTDRQLDKELHEINIRKRNREVDHFLLQRQFFMEHVFTNSNELRFSRFKNQSATTSRRQSLTTSRRQSCPLFSSPTSTECDQSLNPTVTCLTSGTSGATPSDTSSVTPALPNPNPDSGRTRSQATPRSSQSRSSTTKKDKPSLIMRDLLFLEESKEPPTPNRCRILQARARIFRGNKQRSASGNSRLDRKQDVELPAVCPGGTRFQNKTQVRQTKSAGEVRTGVKTNNVPHTPHQCAPVEDTNCSQDRTKVQDLEAINMTVATSQSHPSQRLLLSTSRSDGLAMVANPHPDGSIPRPDLSTPCPDLSTPRPDGPTMVSTPRIDVSTPRPDGPAMVSTPRPDLSTPRPDISNPRPDGPAKVSTHHPDGPAMVSWSQDSTKMQHLEAVNMTVATSLSHPSKHLLLTTPHPDITTPHPDGSNPRPDRPAKVSWSKTTLEPRATTRVLEGRSAKQRLQPKRTALFSPPEPAVDLEAHERMLQRIMVTIPPDIIAKATVSAASMSDMMGYTEKRENLLKLERRHSQRLDMADTRFVRLMEVLKK